MGEVKERIPELILITGGCRSGKSSYAVERAKKLSGSVIYVATCQPQDDEMRERVERHRRERPRSWKTIEGNLDLAGILEQKRGGSISELSLRAEGEAIPVASEAKQSPPFEIASVAGVYPERSRRGNLAMTQGKIEPSLFLIDCLTLWVSAHLVAGRSKEWILQEAKRTLQAIRQSSSFVIAVTNEVGSGVVPENSLARAFRDLAGEVNQLFAQAADEVIWMVAGIHVKIKSQKEFLYEYPSSAKI